MNNHHIATLIRSHMTKQAGPVGGAAVGGALLPVIGSVLGAKAEKDENRSYRGSPAMRAGLGSALGMGAGLFAAVKSGKRYILLPYLGNIVGGALGAKSVRSRERSA